MAKSTNPKYQLVRRVRQAARSQYALVILPLLAIPLAIWGLTKFKLGSTDEPLTWEWYAGVIGFLLLFPLWAWISSKLTTRYSVTLESVMEERGFIKRASSEIRIVDIRNITIRQGILDRLFLVGDVAFSSAAGDSLEVVFPRVSRPHRLRDLVKDIQDKLSDGVIDERERAELGLDPIGSGKPAGKAKAKAEPAPKKQAPKKQAERRPAPADDDDDDRSELYRLLAQQSDEGIEADPEEEADAAQRRE